MKTKLPLAAGWIVLLGVVLAYGQLPPLKAKIDFSFTAGGKVLPAGEYEIVIDTTANVVRVEGQGNAEAALPIITRTSGEMRANPREADLVFDVVGDTYVLSEVWSPAEDSYLVMATKAPHEHKVIRLKH